MIRDEFLITQAVYRNDKHTICTSICKFASRKNHEERRSHKF